MPIFNPKDSERRVGMLGYDWGRRAMNPAQPYIQNDDGSRSTHLMAAELDDEGRAWAFPMIVQKADGSLHQFKDPREALSYAKRAKQAMPFDSIEAAVEFSTNYKRGTPMDPEWAYGLR